MIQNLRQSSTRAILVLAAAAASISALAQTQTIGPEFKPVAKAQRLGVGWREWIDKSNKP
jgi:hypothetical protein